MGNRDPAALHPAFRERLELMLAAFKERHPDAPAPFMTDGFRTFEEQDALYAQGRTKPGPIVTDAKAGESFHNYGLAADVAFRGANLYPLEWLIRLGTLAEEFGLRWGIDDARPEDRKDKPHLQMRATLEQARTGKLPPLPPPPLNILVLNNVDASLLLALAMEALEGRPVVVRREFRITIRGQKLDIDLKP